MTTFKFTASDHKPLFVYVWEPQVTLRGVIHIVHGLAEHAARYARFAEALGRHGFVVYAHDQRGHGQTAQNKNELGFLAERDGWQRLVCDVEELLNFEKENHPHLPQVIFGHSMGSYVVQELIIRQSQRLSAAILSGANGQQDPLALIGRLIARIERWRLGAPMPSTLINRLAFGNFNRQFQPTRTEFDWLSRDKSEVDKYVADALCGFNSSTQLWIDLLDAIPEILKPHRKKSIRADLPILIIAGSRDPVCAGGRGAKILAEKYQQAGLKKVSCRIYEEARHELLNEINRDEVTMDIINWLNQVFSE